MAQIVAATRNSHKLEEYKKFLAEQKVEVLSLLDYPNFPDVEENGTTFEENASIKALAANNYCDIATFADDSGLEVTALNNAPGIHSSRYAPTDEQRIERLLRELDGAKDRRARFVCVIAIAVNGEVIEKFRGEVAGEIALAPRGENGFGYDPVFIPEGYEQTFGELASEVKNKISHRANAFAKALAFVEEEMSVLDDEFGDI